MGRVVGPPTEVILEVEVAVGGEEDTVDCTLD
jgi:hypothetical protein